MTVGSPADLHAQHQGVDEETDQFIERGVSRPAIGNPTATSEFALTAQSRAASAAWTTMKLVALCSRATSRTRCCNSAGHSTATLAPR